MITNRTGDLLEQVDLELIAHRVNCKGAMGAGLAKAIAHRYPKVYQKYRSITLAYGEKLMGTFAAIGTDGRTLGVPHGIGCGLAGGDWNLVYGILDRIFGHDDRVELVIVRFEP